MPPSGIETSVEQSWIHAIRADPENVRAYCGLADAYRANGALGRADLTLRRAAQLAPLDAGVWKRLGTVRSLRGEWRLAADAFEQATAMGPADAESWCGYARALVAIQDLDEAARVSAHLLTAFPQCAASHLIAAHLCKIRGELPAALDAYRRTLGLDPDHSEALYNLVEIETPPIAHPLTERLEALFTLPTTTSRDRANLCSALARIYETGGRFDRAFTMFAQANEFTRMALQGSVDAYRPDAIVREAEQIIELFGWGERRTLAPLQLGVTLVFIVGMPRSGTTLIEQMLGRHSRVTAGGELPGMYECLTKLRRTRFSSDGSSGVHGEGERRRLLEALRIEYLDALLERGLDSGYVTDKLPANFASIGLIRTLFPDAYILHCVREPVATCWSLFSSHFDRHLGYYTSFQDIAHYYRHFYARLMDHWTRDSTSREFDVRYEDLVRDPERTLAQVLAHCRLAPEGACFSPENGPATAIFTSSLLKARRPIFTDSLQRWRRYEAHLTPLIQGLRYIDGVESPHAS